MDRLHVQVAGARGVGQHQAGAALAGDGAVEQMEGVSHHAGGQNVVGGDEAAVVHRFRVPRAVVADAGRHLGERLRLGSVEVHVAPRHERELRRREEPPALHELVAGPGPRRRRHAVGVLGRLGRGDQRHLAQPRRDRQGGFDHGRDADLAAGPAGPATEHHDRLARVQALHRRRHVHAVHVRQAQARRRQGAVHGVPQHVGLGLIEHLRLARVVGADDDRVVEGRAGHAQSPWRAAASS